MHDCISGRVNCSEGIAHFLPWCQYFDRFPHRLSLNDNLKPLGHLRIYLAGCYLHSQVNYSALVVLAAVIWGTPPLGLGSSALRGCCLHSTSITWRGPSWWSAGWRGALKCLLCIDGFGTSTSAGVPLSLHNYWP